MNGLAMGGLSWKVTEEELWLHLCSAIGHRREDFISSLLILRHRIDSNMRDGFFLFFSSFFSWQ